MAALLGRELRIASRSIGRTGQNSRPLGRSTRSVAKKKLAALRASRILAALHEKFREFGDRQSLFFGQLSIACRAGSSSIKPTLTPQRNIMQPEARAKMVVTARNRMHRKERITRENHPQGSIRNSGETNYSLFFYLVNKNTLDRCIFYFLI